MKIDANGAVGEANAHGDFRAGQALDEAKNERLAISFREGTDGIEDGVGFGAGVRRGTEGGGRLLFVLGGSGIFVELVVGFGTTMKIGGAIARDGGEPTGEFGGFTEGTEARQGLEKDVLDEIVDVGIRHAGEKDAVDHARVTGVKKTEGGAVALLRGADERVVGAAVFRRGDHGCETGMEAMEFKECRHVVSIEIKERLLG